ncbi:MAG TPA: hypothetical protein VMV25_09460 [Steroidobacteraceae bacterium]|nr:hypothetical protein [Steroidobacteraceae bacterium]
MHRESHPSLSLSGLLFAAVIAAVSWAPAAWSAAVVTSKLQVRQVQSEHGHERLGLAAAAKPGDLLQYRAVYRNSGDAPATHLLARVPVPLGTTLLTDSLKPAGAEASTDGTHFAPLPLMQSVSGKDGKRHRQPVPAADIRAVRWNLRTLAPGQSARVLLRVRINLPQSPISP